MSNAWNNLRSCVIVAVLREAGSGRVSSSVKCSVDESEREYGAPKTLASIRRQTEKKHARADIIYCSVVSAFVNALYV